MTSRRIVLGGLLTIYFGDCCSHSHAAQSDDGCWLDGKLAESLIKTSREIYSFAGSGPEIIHASGNPLLDKALAVALFRMSRDFDVLPGFGFFDGDGARAMAEQRLNRADGTILMGLTMLRRLLARPEHPDACVVAVCAHEFAHIVQYKRGLQRKLRPTIADSPKPVELHADYMSGWFAGMRKLKNPDYPAVAFANLALSQDDSHTHGKAVERGSAVQAGFLASARDRRSLDEALQDGIRYVAAAAG